MNRKTECIERLLEKNHLWVDISDWLIDNNFTNKLEVKELTRTIERAQFIYDILKENEANNKIILLDFEWILLPKEYIKIICTTQTEEKEFTYGL